MKKLFIFEGFSLVEMLMALLVASLLLAALAPVMTRRMNENMHITGDMTLKGEYEIEEIAFGDSKYCPKIINDAKGIAIGARHITISTCGIVPKIQELAKEELQVNLAISLHAPTNELRNRLMPVNKAYSLDLLMGTIKEYIQITNRRVTIEYVMLNGVNDSDECAHTLARLIKGMNVYVNLIPYNETNHMEFKRSSKEQVMHFYDILKKHGLSVTIRKEFGRNIDAACGQLRSKEVKV